MNSFENIVDWFSNFLHFRVSLSSKFDAQRILYSSLPHQKWNAIQILIPEFLSRRVPVTTSWLYKVLPFITSTGKMSNPILFRSLFAFSMRIIGLDVCRLLIGLIIHNNRHAFLRARLTINSQQCHAASWWAHNWKNLQVHWAITAKLVCPEKPSDIVLANRSLWTYNWDGKNLD